MKLLIASDIHGSVLYCRKLLDLLAQEKADRLLLLGDLLYHGARGDLSPGYDTRAVTAMLNAVEVPVCSVRGNCDSDIDQTVLQFPILADFLLLLQGRHTVFATHGHIYTPDSHPRLLPGDVFLSGHIHVPVCEMRDGIIVVNPGSVSMPKDGSPHSCMTLEDGLFRWFDLDRGTDYQTFQMEA